MALPYEDIYDRWQRSKSFGDPRDLPTFSNEMNQVTGTNDFDAGVRSNWWTRASRAADVNFFEPIARGTGLEAAGRAIGGLFGDPYAEAGARVARSLPRTVAQTLPLVAAEVASGGAATPLVVGGALASGGLFGAQTYAETGDPTAAAISGATAAALPAVSRVGGAAGRALLGGSKWGSLLGSQAAQIGTMEASSAAQAKRAGVPFNPLSPDFLAQQIPYSLLDIGRTAFAKPPPKPLPPVFPKGFANDYVPPKGPPEAEANLGDMLDRMSGLAKDQTITPEEKAKLFSELLRTVMNPEQTRTTPQEDKVILIGHPKIMDNGSIKLYGVASKYYDLPEHSNVFINNPDSATQMVNPDGSVTFITNRKNVSSNVKYPARPEDFPALRSQKGQVQLPTEPIAPVEGGGVNPETDLLSLRQKFQQTVGGNDTMFQAALGKEPKDPDQAVAYWQQAIDKMTPEHLKPGFQSPFDSGEQQVLKEAGVEPDEFGTSAALQFPDGRVFTGGTHGHAYLEAEKAGYGNQVPSATGFIKNGKFEPGESITEGHYIDQPVQDVTDDIRKTQGLSNQIEQVEQQIKKLTGDKLSTAEFKYSQKAFGKSHYSDEIDKQLGDLFAKRRELEDQLPESAHELGVTIRSMEDEPSALSPFGVGPDVGNPLNLTTAIRLPNGKIFSNEDPSLAHFEIPEAEQPGAEFGFTDKEGKFYTRQEASQESQIAVAKQSAQQIETSHAAADDAQAKLDLVPKSAQDVQEVLYHGTNQPVFKFTGDNPVYLTSNLTTARFYGSEGGRIVSDRPQYGPGRVLKIKAQFGKVLDITEDEKPLEQIIKKLGIRASTDEVMFGADLRSNEVFDELKKQGYDAVRYYDQNPRTGDITDAVLALNPEKLQVEMTRAAVKQAIANGATPTQAAEQVRLQQQTPVVDKAKQQINLSQEELRDQMHEQLLALSAAARPVPQEPLINPKTGKLITGETEAEREILRAEANKRLKQAGLPVGGVAKKEGAFPEKPQAIYDDKNSIKDTNGKPFKTRALAEAFKEADPDLAEYVVRDQGKGKGFTLAKQINKETSYEGAPGTSLENVIPTEDIRDTLAQEAATEAVAEPLETGVFTPDAEDRPEVSFNDYLNQLDLASQNPTRLRNAAGFDDLPTAITAIRQFRTFLTDVVPTGKTDLKSVNAALKKAKVLSFDSEKEMRDTFKKMRSGMEEFTNKYRNYSLDSQIPHDPELAAEIGVLHPTQGARNFLDWFIRNTPTGDLRDLVTGLRSTSDFSHLNITNEEGKGFWYSPKDKQINLNRLPSDREDALNTWGPQVLEELAHDTMRDLPTRTDPAAMEFKATLQRILKTVRDSKQIPEQVRKAVQVALKEDWYSKGAEHYNAKYDEHLPGRESWKGVHYSLLNEYELVGGIFSSPELRRILMNTTMPKSPVPILNFFANAWARMFGYTPNAGNAFAKILASYDNYLSGSRNARGYNGISYIRDSLVAAGVTPQQMASRLNGVAEMYNKGDLSAPIKAFEQEMKEGLLPATTAAGPLNENLKSALITGDAKATGEATDNLLAEELPQHRELWLRLKDDLQIAKNLYDHIQKGNLYGEQSLFQEGLKNQGSKLNAMKNALDKYDKALGRLSSIDALGNNEGISRLWSSTLKGNKVAEPTDQSGNEDIARQALGLEAPSAEFITNRRRQIAETGAKPMSWIDKNFKFASFTAEEQPGFKPIYESTHESQADAYRRIMELQMVKNSGAGGGWNKEIAKSNKRVYQTPGLDRIASDILRRAQVMDKMNKPFSFEDPEVAEALRRASTAKGRGGVSDREAVITAVNSEFARAQHYINSVVPEHLTRMNRILTTGAIIGREIGMPYTKAWDLSGQLYTALGQLRDPAQAPLGAEALRAISTQMQPDTFTKVLAQTQGFINDSEQHIKVLQKYQHYVSEQRYGNYHLVMSREGEPLRESYNTEKAARARAKLLQTDGWVLEDIVPKNRTNVANTWGHDPVVQSMQELDQQALNRFESLIADLPKDKQDQLRPLVQRAADYQSSNAAFTPIPTQASPRRRFVPGRETIDMIDNAEQYYRRSINWMRHRETRAQTAFQMLDPEILGNRPLREYAQQFVDNQLAPDNPVARRLAEATFYWNLAGNLGVDFLHSIQSLTTGMASVIRETGSTADALKYVTGASGKVFKRYTTGKWGDANTERYINWLTSRGALGLPAWGDMFDPTTMNYFDSNGPESGVGKTLNAIKNGVRGYKGIFLRHNDMVGALAGFQLGLDRGMSWEDAARFGEGVKDRGFYSAGKAQRPVGLWSIKEKAVPQMLSALRTYILGWFSQLSHNYKVGFANAPGEYSPTQRAGAKQAFAYMLGAQAVLAGALGLPGVGQGLGLLKQTTGLDLKGWTRKNLAAMFGEDQDDYGGLMTGLAMHGLVSQFAPFDPSGRHIPNFPFIGVTPSKGFDISSLIPAPFTTAADIIGGLGAAAKGQDPMRALPIVARGPVSLMQGGGDIRNSRGELIYQLSPTERVVKALGLEPSRISAAKETAATVNEMNKAAAVHKDRLVDEVATLSRRGDKVNAQRRLAEIQKENPTYDMASFVRSVASAVEKQTIPFDWKREVNPALDIVGLSSNQPSQELNRLQLRHGVASDLGLFERPSLRSNIRAASIDDLMNSDPYTTRAAALQRLLTARQLQRRNISLEPVEYQ